MPAAPAPAAGAPAAKSVATAKPAADAKASTATAAAKPVTKDMGKDQAGKVAGGGNTGGVGAKVGRDTSRMKTIFIQLKTAGLVR